jgi:hypothetical protein
MKCVLAAACVFAAVFAQPADSYAGGVDSLWARAVSLNSANSNWVPGSIYMHMQEVDKHGEPKDGSGHEVWTRLYLGEEGEVESEMVKVLDDGEDITQEERARREKEDAERDDDEDGGDRMVMESYSPFDPEHQGGVEARATGEEEAVDGRPCAVFEFTDERESEDEDEEGTVMGKVWLEIETGIPLKAEYTTDPLPKRVKKMNTTVLYEYSGPEAWYAGSMNIRATGGILFIKKHFSMTMTFSDYWRMPEADSVSAGAGEAVLP